VKELIDNSVAACNLSIAMKLEIVLNIFPRDECTEEYFDLTIIDNGCGMEDPKRLIQFFSSEKDTQNMRSKGKYGVGLTTCLLYSQIFTGQPCR
jgi:DNA topoisomerase VI subunit B